MKFCRTCSTSKPLADFYKDKRRADGLKTQCKSCHTAASVRTRDPAKHRNRNRAWMRTSGYGQRPATKERERKRSSIRRHTPEAKARQALNAAVKAGKIERPSLCERCGRLRRVQGHHHGYSKPLDVVWLCVSCHATEHRKAS